MAPRSTPVAVGLREVAALATTVAGPIAATRAIADLALVPTAVVAVAANVALAVLPVERRGPRLAVLGAAALAVTYVDRFASLGSSVFVALWLVAGLVIADWLLRGNPPPVPGLGRCHPSATAALLVLFAYPLLRTDPAAADMGVSAFVIGAGLAQLAVLGFDAPWRDRAVAVGAIALVTTVGAWGGNRYAIEPAVGTPVLVALGTCAFGATGDRTGARWSLLRRFGPLALAAPAALWWMVNLGLFLRGSLTTDQSGWRAWSAAYSMLAPRLTGLVAWSGVPLTLLGLLGVGAYLSVTGRRGAARVAAAVAVAVATTTAITWSWQIGIAPR